MSGACNMQCHYGCPLLRGLLSVYLSSLRFAPRAEYSLSGCTLPAATYLVIHDAGER